MKKKNKIFLSFILLIVVGIGLFIFIPPIKRINVYSSLIMLGDLNDDKKWDQLDMKMLQNYIDDPFSFNTMQAFKIDVNKNGMIDEDDISYLKTLYEYKEPYVAQEKAQGSGQDSFPFPREFFRYINDNDYVQRPIHILPANSDDYLVFDFLSETLKPGDYSQRVSFLLKEIYSEALRFSKSYNKRRCSLSQVEQNYADEKFKLCAQLYKEKSYYELLLQLIGMTEDAETLYHKEQSDIVKRILYFRDHLRDILMLPEYSEILKSENGQSKIFSKIEKYLLDDMDIKLNLTELPPPRDLKNINNYLDRAQWQYYKSVTDKDVMKKLINYAQHDRRYLRAVSKTSRKHDDIKLQNHNLPMVLLYREALTLTKGDKKAAAGLLDEAIRIPLGWVKSIPKEMLPSSVALENFLLPGNKEDGSDKSRHWNVFGTLSVYKSPKEALILSLQREMMDIKEAENKEEALTEFIRDSISNINGIYYVSTIKID